MHDTSLHKRNLALVSKEKAGLLSMRPTFEIQYAIEMHVRKGGTCIKNDGDIVIRYRVGLGLSRQPFLTRCCLVLYALGRTAAIQVEGFEKAPRCQIRVVLMR